MDDKNPRRRRFGSAETLATTDLAKFCALLLSFVIRLSKIFHDK